MDNLKRFYEPENPMQMLKIHLKLWGLDCSKNIGPVNTNFKEGNTNIKLVVICESPSYAEVKVGFPAVCSTGNKIYNAIVRSKFISPKTDLPNNYCFCTHYEEFESNGIYITNLVRFQADYGLKGSDISSRKNDRVKRAWQFDKETLFDELTRIKENSNPYVLIACGTAFENFVLEVVNKLNSLGMTWFITLHPSRHKKKYDFTYNPSLWNNDNSLCELHQSINKTLRLNT